MTPSTAPPLTLESGSSPSTVARRLLRAKGSVIDNECSMARDQFAAERNFLSWVKLSMALVASTTVIVRDFGIVKSSITQLADITTVYFLALAMLLLVVSTFYVWETQSSLATHKRPLRFFHPLLLQVFGSVGAVSLIFAIAVLYWRHLTRLG
ncbi:hypothetical protein IWW39_002325 [Coemansia spiralis]|uniref:DUF202 domain-containing protein n=1 Tax=Coemansia spiralis TaxID=417178 RepID=A0A9W8GKD7_9FUNG|nr:hypothetical protein IWW39_002325 [Coemansia spiralis]